MSEYHEPYEELDAATRDAHRALTSLKEEVEAADWYDQRLKTCSDPELRRILQHNRDEETEHASMLIEWLRRTKPEWKERLASFVFTERTLGVEAEGGAASERAEPAQSSGRGLGIGSLRKEAR